MPIIARSSQYPIDHMCVTAYQFGGCRIKDAIYINDEKYRRLLRSLSIHNIKAQVSCSIIGFTGLHALAMVYFEGVLWGDAIWLTLTTVTTVGYGDFSALTPIGRSATAVLIYGFGIAIWRKWQPSF